MKVKKNLFYRTGRALANARASLLSGFYSVHLKIRYLHDRTYQRGGTYKKWSDQKYSSAVHKTIMASFIASFIIFSLAQNLFPNFFDLTKPNTVIAGNNTKVWTTQTDWQSGTLSNLDSTTTAGDLMLSGPSDWYNGRAGTAMQGKQVYYQDSGDAQWKTSRTSCNSPQCATGLDPNYLSSYALVSPQTNPGVDFSTYPAQNACKAMGGRLPYMDELIEIYYGKDSYGGNLNGTWYWSGTENNSTHARLVQMEYGWFNNVGYKDGSNRMRCVRNTSTPYNTTGTLGETNAALSHDTGANGLSKWSSLSWSANTLVSGQAIRFQVSTDGVNWKGSDGSAGNWNNNFLGQVYGGSAITSLLNIPLSRYLYIKIKMDSSGANTPILHDLTLNYDTLEAPSNSNLSLTKTDSSTLNNSSGTQITAGVPGGYTNETSLKVTATGLTCTDCGTSTNIRPEVEVKETGMAFTGTGTTTATAGNNYAIISGLSSGTPYHLQVRSIDDQGRVSGWTSYGGNTDPNDADFTVEQTAPSGTVSINSGDTYTKSRDVTLTISGIDNGSVKSSPNATDLSMRLSNDGAFETSPEEDWQAYAASKAWTLTAGDAQKTVYIQFRDNAGNVGASVLHTDTNGFLGTYNEGQVSKTTEIQLLSDINAIDTQSAGCSTPSMDPDPCTTETKTNNLATHAYVQITCEPGQAGMNNCSLYINGVNVANYNDLGGGSYRYPISGWNAYSTPVSVYATASGDPDGLAGVSFTVTFGKNTYPLTSDYVSQAIPNPGAGININWNDSTTSPNGGSVAMNVRGGNDVNMAGATSWVAVTKGGAIPATENIRSKPYLQYRITLNSGANQTLTPVIYDVIISFAYSASITLDTAPPTAFSLASPANNTWSTDSTPNLTWNDSASADVTSYEVYVDGAKVHTTANGDTNSYNLVTPISETSHPWYIKAVDGAGNPTNSSETWNVGYDITPPIAPASFTTTGAVDTIELAWSFSNNTGSPLDKVKVERIDYTAYDPGDPGEDWSAFGSYKMKEYAGNSTGVTYSVNDIDPDIKLVQGKRYAYRIVAKDTVNAAYGTLSVVRSGMTQDNFFDATVQNVTVAPCNVSNCSTDPEVTRHKGYEVKITWDPAIDSGVGTSHYLIYRSVQDLDAGNYTEDSVRTGYQIVGVLPYASPQQPTWYDNDFNNTALTTFHDATGADIVLSPEIQALTTKTEATPTLSDYTIYYYRVMGVDGNDKKSLLFPESPSNSEYDVMYSHTNGNTGEDAERTPDVTAPTAPSAINPVATGIDSLNTQPDPTQGILVSWNFSTDNSERTVTYKLYRSKGTISGPGTWEQNPIYTGSNTSYQDEGLDQDSYYYYRLTAQDPDANISDLSDNNGVKTRNSQVPTTPTYVTVTAKKGDPNTDDAIGTEMTVRFNGSAIRYASNKITGYEVFRSTTNLATDGEWLSAEKIKTYSALNVSGYEGNISYDITREFTDTVTSDATSYYYRIRAIGQNPDGEVLSGLSSVQVGTLHYGWDTTPDTTAPDQPAEVRVKDIHGNDSMVRNIITWQVIATPTRNGSNDFRKYEVWRYETAQGIGSAIRIAQKTDIGDNYYVDGIANSAKDIDYSYYVVAFDNAGTEYKYSNNMVINSPYDNISSHQAPVSINPGTVKPTVTNTSAVNIGVSSATITWDTNQPTDSLVEYRIKDSATVIAAGKDRTTPVINHTVNLSSLEKNKTYQYRIISRNSLGNYDEVAAGNWNNEFTTVDFSITNITVETTTTTATVKWSTQVAADSSVEYKPENTNITSKTAGDPNLVTSHVVNIGGPLKPATTYTYKIRSVTADNYIADTAFASFSTKPYDSSQFIISPNASNIAEENITATSAKIVWNTAVATTTWVDFGTEAGVYGQSTGDNTYNTVHVVELKNLTPGNTYYYKVRGKDTSDVEYTSQEYKFTAVLKPEIQALKLDIIDSYNAKVTFSTNVDTESSVSFGEDGKFDQKAGIASFTKTHQIEIKNLTDNTAYSYYVEVKDKIGNSSKTETRIFNTPIDTIGPEIKEVKIDILPMGDSDETGQAIVSWTTSKPSTTKVEYGEGIIGGKYEKSSIEDKSLNNSHTVIIKELNPSVTYHLRIISRDKRENETKSNDHTFVTPTKEKSILQLILKSLEETFSWVKNVGSFFRNIRDKAR